MLESVKEEQQAPDQSGLDLPAVSARNQASRQSAAAVAAVLGFLFDNAPNSIDGRFALSRLEFEPQEIKEAFALLVERGLVDTWPYLHSNEPIFRIRVSDEEISAAAPKVLALLQELDPLGARPPHEIEIGYEMQRSLDRKTRLAAWEALWYLIHAGQVRVETSEGLRYFRWLHQLHEGSVTYHGHSKIREPSSAGK